MILTKYVTKRGKQIEVSSLPPNSNKKVDVVCGICGNTREAFYSLIVRTGHTNCHKCMLVQNNTKIMQDGEKHNRLTFIKNDVNHSGKALFKCDCGVETVLSRSLVRNGTTKSCGCLKKDSRFSEQRSGEDHPNWKGGVTSQRERDMQSSEYKAWRKSVFLRDCYCCKSCSCIGGTLVAHHILPYRDFPDIRTELSNGITLCRGCHCEFHFKYGFTEFTAKDLEEFLNSKQCVSQK